ncbi:MAG: aminotransferase class V-fold PLP-dependent enzyme [SAR324 cluster bacterium]|nr:aminotransferase class V-fold PLP-dependent enzyme [SAR324 cluster bacterium]
MNQKNKQQNSKQGEFTKTICGICPAGCWVEARLDETGKLTELKADSSSSLGTICHLGEASPEIVYSKDRITTPMKRVGPKGSFEFVPISWDEAMDTIAKKQIQLKEDFGPESLAIYTGRGSFDLSLCDVYQPAGVAVSSAASVLFPLGSPNTLGVGALCYVSFAMIAPHVTLGGMLINMYSDIEQAEVVVIWGANPATDSPPLDYQRITDAHARGAKVIVIDPRETALAKLEGADWVPIRPGTDGALALGLAQVIITEELYDEGFVKDWTLGFEEFESYVQHFRPEVVENITGVPASVIIELARTIASAKGAAPVMYSGLEYSESGVQAIRATLILWGLAGQLDVPGGRCFTMSKNHFKVNRDGLVANPAPDKALGRDRFPVYSHYRGESHAISLPESVLESKPYKIRSLIVLGGSIITSWPEPKIWRETLENLDFLVTIDRQLTADSAYADIVLPATTGFEIDSYMVYGPIFKLREKLIEPVGEARNDFFILSELAERLGYGELYPQNKEELYDYVLKGTGFSYDQVKEKGGQVSLKTQMMEYKKWEKGGLRPDGKPGFDTPSGKLEITSSLLEEFGYNPLPVYTEPAESPISRPDLVGEFPLVFNSGSRVTTDFRSQHHGVESLSKIQPEPVVTLNDKDAKARSIEDGALVLVKSPRGSVTMRAYVTGRMVQGAIDANMGGGGPVGPEAWQKNNINDLTNLQQYDPISGFPVYKALLCDVLPLEGEKRHTGSGEYAALKSKVQVAATRIYFDHNATSPLASAVKEAMHAHLDDFGNPSSIYTEGKKARAMLDQAKRYLGQLLNCTAKRLIITSGGSEANNLALKGLLHLRGKRNHFITSDFEHPSILNTCKQLEAQGIRVTYLPINSQGFVTTEALELALDDDCFGVSIMLANNELGTIQPIAELCTLAHKAGAWFHCDAVQAVGKIPIDVTQLPVDALSLSAHKFQGPKGAGALYLRKGLALEPLIAGGSQEYGLRGGTENSLALIGLGKACEEAIKQLKEFGNVAVLRDRLEKGILDLIPGAQVNGDQKNRLPHCSNLTLPQTRGESLVLAMDMRGFAFSSGSACQSGSPAPSHCLLALGLTEPQAHCSIRLSLGVENTLEEVDLFLKSLEELLLSSSQLIRFVPCR